MNLFKSKIKLENDLKYLRKLRIRVERKIEKIQGKLAEIEEKL